MNKLLTLIVWASCLSSLFAASPYIAHVYDFCPAPGQFTNTLPTYEAGDNATTMAAKAQACLANHNQEMVSLGGWGGYIVFGFDHPIINLPNEYDFKILGNAFYAASNQDSTRLNGSSEPGIVMVSRDINGNGIPDDPWYELAGSEYTNPLTKHHYTITYYRHNSDSIRWQDSEGVMGYITKNSFHKQDYFPQWIAADSLTFHGSRLPDNSVDLSGKGTNYTSYCFDYGYADNQPNEVTDHPERHASEFMIDWAVDENGQHVHLDAIDFVKVYTATHQYNGWLGESSTEILDAWDIHALAMPEMASFEETDITPLYTDSTWMPTQSQTFRSGSYAFQSSVQDYGTYGVYYYGFVVSNQTDTTYAYYADAYKSAAGGAYEGDNYAVWYADYYGYDRILLAATDTITGCYITNTTWVINSITQGDGFTDAFTTSDWLLLTAYGWKGGEITDSVQLYLAQDGHYLTQWTWMDLSSLGAIDQLSFVMTGSKTNAFGLATPTYFCMDNFGDRQPISEDVEWINATPHQRTARKVLHQGHLYIDYQGQRYSILGYCASLPN